MQQQNSMQVFTIPNGDVPVLSSWEIDPFSPEALEQYERAMVTFFTKREMEKRDPPISYEEALQLSEPEKIHLISLGAIEGLKVMAEGSNMRDRATTSLAYKMFKASIHAHDKEKPATFEEFLWAKLGHVKSQGAISELKFMLELFETFELQGQKEFVENLFPDYKGYAKFAKGIPVIRHQLQAVNAGERHFEEVDQRLEDGIRSANTPAEAEQLLWQKEKGKEHRSKIVGKLFDDLKSTIQRAAELSKDPTIDAESIPAMLRGEESKNSQKLRVDKFLMANSVTYIISVAKGYEKMVEKAIEDFCDVRITDPHQALEKFKPFLD